MITCFHILQMEHKVLKQALTFIMAASIFFMPGLRADLNMPEYPEDTEVPAYGPVEAEPDTDEIRVSKVKPEIKQVGKASTDGMSAAKLRQIQNICLAAGVIAIAVTTLVLVNNHHSHHHKKHHDRGRKR